MFGLSTAELVIILVIVLLLFGAGKLPQVAKQLGSGIKDFQDSLQGKEKEEPKQLTNDTRNNDNTGAPMGGIDTKTPTSTGSNQS